MPNMLPLLMPHITPMMIACIKTGQAPMVGSAAETAATKDLN